MKLRLISIWAVSVAIIFTLLRVSLKEEGVTLTSSLDSLLSSSSLFDPPPNCSKNNFVSQVNLDILQKAPEVDLTFTPLDDVNISAVAAWNDEGEKSVAFRLDEKAHLKNASFTFQSLLRHDNKSEICNSSYEEIVPMQNIRVETYPNPNRPLRLLCGIYSTKKSLDRIRMIRRTWAQKCDGLVVVSDVTISELNCVQVEHRGEEAYNNMWQKLQAMWSYLYQHYYNEYDWFHVGGDDMFVITENMRAFLTSPEIECASPDGKKPLYLGLRFAESNNMNQVWATGGPGYTLNKAALKLLIVEILPKIDFAHEVVSVEDMHIARAFRQWGVYPLDTRDKFGSQRYVHWKPSFVWTYIPKLPCKAWWYGCTETLAKRWGHDYMSYNTVSLHKISPHEMKMIFAWLHGYCHEYGGPFVL